MITLLHFAVVHSLAAALLNIAITDALKGKDDADTALAWVNGYPSLLSFAWCCSITALVLHARLFVDCRESTVNEAGDFLIPKKEGAVTDEHIQGELGEILLGGIQGRQSADEVTLFKSLGVAVEDLAAATYVYTEAKDRGVGTEVELGGTRS